MATDRLAPDEYDLQSEREARLDSDYEREHRRTFAVAVKRFAESPADVLERIALKCSAAFVSADPSATGEGE